MRNFSGKNDGWGQNPQKQFLPPQQLGFNVPHQQNQQHQNMSVNQPNWNAHSEQKWSTNSYQQNTNTYHNNNTNNMPFNMEGNHFQTHMNQMQNQSQRPNNLYSQQAGQESYQSHQKKMSLWNDVKPGIRKTDSGWGVQNSQNTIHNQPQNTFNNLISNPQTNQSLHQTLGKVIEGLGWQSLLHKHNLASTMANDDWRRKQEQSWKHPTQPIYMNDEKYRFPNPLFKYKIIPLIDEKKSLDVTSKDELDKGLVKNTVIIWDYHGGPNQQFYINKQKNGKYVIINVSTGFYLSVPNNSSKDQIQMKVSPPLEQQSQYWDIKSNGVLKNQLFTITSFCGKSLDVEGGSTKNGSRVIQWAANAGKNQKWTILPV